LEPKLLIDGVRFGDIEVCHRADTKTGAMFLGYEGGNYLIGRDRPRGEGFVRDYMALTNEELHALIGLVSTTWDYIKKNTN